MHQKDMGHEADTVDSSVESSSDQDPMTFPLSIKLLRDAV
jgi:hypothetical protein